MMSSPLRLYSWNVNGLRAIWKKGFLDWLEATQPDVVGLQETKLQGDQLTLEMAQPLGYHAYWSFAERKGYSGVVILSKEKPQATQEGFGIGRFDCEGRTIVADYGDFVLYNIYFPNGQRSEERLQYKLDFYDAFLEHATAQVQAGKRLVVCGDYNTAHHPIDLARPKENEKTSGFLPIERTWMDRYEAAGFTDTFRGFHPDEANRYSWWNMRSRARERNVGWRIDYFFTSANLLQHLHDAEIHDQVLGSDHCPVSLSLAF